MGDGIFPLMASQLLGVSLQARRDTSQLMLEVSLSARSDTTLVMLKKTLEYSGLCGCVLCLE